MGDLEIELFGKALMTVVRDESIRDCDRALSVGAVDPRALRWQAARASGKLLDLEAFIPEIVDIVVFNLLDAIDNGSLRLAYTSAEEDDNFADLNVLASEELGGDLKAEVCAIDGWRDRYAQERFFDDCADLREQSDEG